MSENRKEIRPYEFIEYFMKDTALLVTMDNNGNPNVMALDWKTIGELWMIPIITVAVSPSRYSFELLTNGVDEFTLNIPSNKITGVIDITGAYSGRNTDKFKIAHLEIIEGNRTKIPTIKDCTLNYECKIVHSCESGSMAGHHLFFGQVLTAFAANDIIT